MDSPVVTIAEGKLRGNQRSDIDGAIFYSFLGIPYAQPPIGELRFKAPLPAEPWHAVRDATKVGPNCFARDDFTAAVQGSEDCLTLNVFTRELPDCSKQVKPVMVYIHGGAFISGSSDPDLYGPEFLMTQDVVLVTINYRIGLLGFLTLEDTSLGVPGNAGLKDQRLALQWVQRNIRNFNGDPDNVTIFGESAGSASVHYQVLSSTTNGLFHKAIMQSGSALNHWAYGKPCSEQIAALLGHEVKSEKEALAILTNVPVDELYGAQEKFKDPWVSSQRRYYGPVIERPNDTAFITKDPIDIILSGQYNKVPMMFGYTTREGMLLGVLRYMMTMRGISIPNEQPNLEDAIPWQVNLDKGTPQSLLLAKKIGEMYFKGPNQEENMYLLLTDSSFVSGILASVKNHVGTSQNPVYLYRVSVESGLNFLKHVVKITLPGVCHGDDLGYLFKNKLTPEIESGSLEDVSFRRFVKLWTNFAKYGNPTPDQQELGVIWESVTDGKSSFLDIGKDLEILENPESERMGLWKEIFQVGEATQKFL